MKFSTKDFFSKCDQISRKLQIWSHLLKKSLMKNFIFVPYITKHLAQNYELKQADLFYANLFTSLEASASFMKIEERSLFITSPYPFEIFPLVLEKKAAVVAG